jgi:hypothetical protein
VLPSDHTEYAELKTSDISKVGERKDLGKTQLDMLKARGYNIDLFGGEQGNQ